MAHQFRVGGDAWTHDQRRVSLRYNSTVATPYAIDIFNPVYGQPKPVATLNQDLLEELRGQCLYAQDLVTLGRLTALLGLRHDWVQQTEVAPVVRTVWRLG
ncbi:TonB-dependent receptor domain-containing protein [Caulobacter sp. DWR1-3-2b1]|uniref:TonB-dependent receptor domain-containing protein n=1 Tax=Caulobacter sp. DWR1-3-2b1 TaxID=2804670 RepID=UPI003CF4510A